MASTHPPIPLRDFLRATKIKTPQDEGASAVPFELWPQQSVVLDQMERERLLVILKARQLGISWLACGYALWLCSQHAGKTVLLFSQGQLEANELIERISFMYHEYTGDIAPLTTANTTELEWSNGSRIRSLPATKRAGRSFSASLVIFDEFAFMLWGSSLYGAAKPTIDDGGKLWIISSADGLGTQYHQFWQTAKAGGNGFVPVFLDWRARPSRDDDWRQRKLGESFSSTAEVLREYPENDIEAFTHAAGLVFDVWDDPGNVTEDAEYIPDAGPIFWALDDGYSAGSAAQTSGRDPKTGYYVADSHPRVILLVQQRDDGRLCVFAEDYACLKLSDQHINEMLALPYPSPDVVVHGPGAAEIRGRLMAADLPPHQSTADVEESVKELRRALAVDANGWRRVLVHPRCVHLRAEMASYRRDATTGKVVKQFDHGPDALRGLVWIVRQ